jgi:hypothetical protein
MGVKTSFKLNKYMQCIPEGDTMRALFSIMPAGPDNSAHRTGKVND